jgi:hypothetical protein
LSQVLDCDAQAVSRGGVRCAPQVLNRGAQDNSCGAAQVLNRSAQAAARGAATLPQQENNNFSDVQRNRVNITGLV